MCVRCFVIPLARRLSLAGSIAVLILALVPNLAFAAETRNGDTVVIGPGETIADDLYVAGRSVTVLGTIKGDLVVSAGTVTVSGPIQGDVIAFGGTVTIQGTVGRNVRAMGGTVSITNSVANDVVAAGGNVTIGPQARVGRDLLVGTGAAVVDGAITRNVVANSGELRLNGPVGGDVRFDGSTILFGNQASIGGNLTYTSDNEALVVAPTGSVVKGRVERLPRAATPAPGLIDQVTESALGWIRGVVGLFVLGLVLVLLFPAFSRRTTVTMEQSPIASLAIGLIALVVAPVVAILIFAFGILVGGWWLGFVTLAIYGIALAIGMAVASLYLGTWILAHAQTPAIHAAWALLLGAAVLLLIGLLPIVGGMVVFAALLFGFGSLLLAAYRAYQESKPAATPSVMPESGPRLSAA